MVLGWWNVLFVGVVGCVVWGGGVCEDLGVVVRGFVWGLWVMGVWRW